MKQLGYVVILMSTLSACSYLNTSNKNSVNSATGSLLPENNSSKLLKISDNAFSGSSINVISGVKQTVFTSNHFQYVAFYNADAHLVLAKRALSEKTISEKNISEKIWQVQETQYKGNVNDAHNYISLVVDANEIIHISWDHHNSPLKYAQSISPGSLTLTKQRMLSEVGQEYSKQEHSVTYPQFYRLANGNLLFAYRDGGSGRGNLILNRYVSQTNTWHRLHDSLIDGEGKRSAYWDMTIDENGILHLAWIWRETPDVATNHDIAYAQSKDEGETWQSIDGVSYQLPIISANSQLAKRIPQHHKLMNPPVISADSDSNPYIASYWANTPSDKPSYHVLFVDQSIKNNAQGNIVWREIAAPKVTQNFELSGFGTKRPPISRAALLIDSSEGMKKLHLIYRDDFKQGHIIASTVDNLAAPIWRHQRLVKKNMGAWEPSIDPVQWQQYKQAHLLIQNVGQDDGNDRQSLQSPPSNIELLMWQPNRNK